MTETILKWKGNMGFEAELNGFKFMLDASGDFGGDNQGPRPKGLLLTALAGCTGMDVVSILKKMKVVDFNFDLKVEGNMTDEHPKIYDKIYLAYNFQGENLPLDKIKKAVKLSEERYCGVSAMLRKSSEIITLIRINGVEV